MQIHVQAPAEQSSKQHQATQQPAQLLAEPQTSFEDSRLQAAQIKAQQAMMGSSPQQQKYQALQAKMNASAHTQNMQTLQAKMVAGVVTQRVEDEEPLQAKLEGETAQRESVAEAPKPNNTGLPNQLKAGIESLSGMSMDHIKVHYNSDKPAQLNAHAYAQGSDIHIAAGQEQHLPHEAWHVVQQAQSRVQPTTQTKGGVPVNDNAGLEREADVMGAKASLAPLAPPQTQEDSLVAHGDEGLPGNRTAVPNSATAQRQVFDQTTLPSDVDKVRTVNNATKNKNTDQPLDREGQGATVKGKVKEWKTQIAWKPIDQPTGDGTGVEAKVLGPDHLMGEPPTDDTCPNVSALNNIAGLDSNKGYVKGHLLNEKLGGPGNDSRNLTAIPRTTNTGGMKDNMEERLKHLVNKQYAWIYFKGNVTFTDGDSYRYASKLDFEWHELAPDDSDDPQAVPGSEGTASFDVPPPEEYSRTDYSRPSYDKPHYKKSRREYGATVTGKAGKSDTLPSAEGGTAIADLPWNAIIMEDWKSANLRRDLLKTIESKVGELGALARQIVDFLSQAPTTEEDELFQWIKNEVTRLEQSQDTVISEELPGKLGAYSQKRESRTTGNLAKVDEALKQQNVSDRESLIKNLGKNLLENDPLKPYSELIRQLLQRLKKQEELNKESTGLIGEFYYGDKEPMSPFSIASNANDDENMESLDQEKFQESKKRKLKDFSTTTEYPTERIKKHKPTRAVDRVSYILVKLKEKKVPPEGFDGLKSSIDPFTYFMFDDFINNQDTLIKIENIKVILKGLELNSPHVFVALARDIFKLFPDLAKEAQEALK